MLHATKATLLKGCAEKMGLRISHDRQLLFFIVCVLFVGCVVRCWNITQSFWWDEIWSTMTYVNAPSLWQVVSSLGYYFNNHIFYSLLARGSIALLGESEFSARLPALVMGLLGIVMLFQFGKRFLGVPSGMIASILLAVSAFHIDHSSEARGYSGLALFSILSSFYFLEGLKTNERKSWMCYVAFTVLGFYSHVFMCAVTLSQVFAFMLFTVGAPCGLWKSEVKVKTFKNFFIALLTATFVTLVLYAPIIPSFFKNLTKVALVEVTRVPFMANLLNAFFPGIRHGIGIVVYPILFLSGMYFIFKKDLFFSLYLMVLFCVPLSLYLWLNPMFVFERYFIFALPFALLVVSQGMVGLTGKLRGAYRNGLLFFLMMVLFSLQIPMIHTLLTQDRQNYREAVRYVENEVNGHTGDLVFSIGYAGEHFRYYASGITIFTPETLDELSKLMEDKERIWCLITAWLPDIRPPYEDRALYAERPGQIELYNYVKQHFVLKKAFASRYPVEVHCLEGLREG